MHCRNCGASLHFVLVDLGSSPLSNAYLTQVTMRRPEKWFPLRVLVCQECWLVQAESYSRAAEIFNDEYAYFSSFSDAWLQHAEAYFIAISEELGLTSTSFVVEIASNDGYLLKHFVAAGVPCLGIEPTASTASAARLAGVPTVERFFGESFALEVRDEHRAADLVIGNNVFAHVPDPIDFLIGIERLLTDSGIATLEFPHLVNLVQQNQFDTIYHEHFAYLSLTATRAMAERAGLQVFRVEDLATHGGSIRVYFQRSETGVHAVHESVDALLAREETLGIDSTEFYSHLQESALQAKNDLLRFLLDVKSAGETICGYGAAAKGNTLLNFAGVRPDLLPFVVDRNPAKQGKFMPGSRIPITGVSRLFEERPKYILVLPWNFTEEIVEQLAPCREWGAQFVTVIPSLSIR